MIFYAFNFFKQDKQSMRMAHRVARYSGKRTGFEPAGNNSQINFAAVEEVVVITQPENGVSEEQKETRV